MIDLGHVRFPLFLPVCFASWFLVDRSLIYLATKFLLVLPQVTDTLVENCIVVRGASHFRHKPGWQNIFQSSKVHID